MLTLKTAKDCEIPITWIGISDFDGSLRFETTDNDLARLFEIFNDPEHTAVITRVFDEGSREFEGFTAFKGIERMSNDSIVIRLMKGEKT